MYYLLIAYYSISEENKFSLRQENIEKNIRDFYFSSQIIKVTTKYRNIELPRHITRFPRGKPPAHCLMNGTRSSLSLSFSLFTSSFHQGFIYFLHVSPKARDRYLECSKSRRPVLGEPVFPGWNFKFLMKAVGNDVIRNSPRGEKKARPIRPLQFPRHPPRLLHNSRFRRVLEGGVN